MRTGFWPSPMPAQRAPRRPVIVPAGRGPEAARERDCESRPQAPHSLRNHRSHPDAPFDERDWRLVTELGTDVKENVALSVTEPAAFPPRLRGRWRATCPPKRRARGRAGRGKCGCRCGRPGTTARARRAIEELLAHGNYFGEIVKCHRNPLRDMMRQTRHDNTGEVGY